MSKYLLVAEFKIDENTHGMRFRDERKITLEFKRRTDIDAISYAFSKESLNVRIEDRKLYKLDVYGSRRRLYSEDGE